MASNSLRLLAALIVGLALAVLPIASATAQASAPGAIVKVDRADAEFLKHAAEAGLAEVEAGRLAVDKGVNTQVKGFGQQMVDDHTRMHAKLRTLSSDKGVRLPIEPSIGQRARIKLLSAADGGSFDRKYAQSMAVKAHEEALKLFQKAATGATDADVKAFAAQALPGLQQHLQTAQELKKVVDKEGNVKARGDVKQ